MKKRYLLAPLALAAALLLAMTGCAYRGTTARNPYEVASELGAEGSMASWLAEKDTKSQARLMFEEAQTEGYTGTYIQFLQEIGYRQDETANVNAALAATVDVYAVFSYPEGRDKKFQSAGAGVIYSFEQETGNAYIVTNYHIVYNISSAGSEQIAHISDDISIRLYGNEGTGGDIPAEYVGGSMDYDIAVLRTKESDALKASNAQAIERGDSDSLTLGERVYAIGNPNMKGLSVVSGVVSVDAEYTNITSADGKRLLSLLEIRTDAPVNHGNSGGGLYNSEGKLIGICNARSEESGLEHFGYAIPANLALAVAQNIIDNSKANGSKGALRATLGVTVGTLASTSCYDEKTGKTYILETVSVHEVSFGSMVYGKLNVGDVLYSVQRNDGPEKLITRLHNLGNFLFDVRKGDTVTITFSRGDKTMRESFVFSQNGDFTLFA